MTTTDITDHAQIALNVAVIVAVAVFVPFVAIVAGGLLYGAFRLVRSVCRGE